ncbi:MAG: hypothetical protein A2X35_13280 [Elusimicrobia bacterium GWA2_61_42]|nr:MAG: hypothetical protein A2X35_13280 [Elusimicrobia bacterium GWA2_61_42]
MDHVRKDSVEFSVSETSENFSYWLNRPYIGGELRKELEKSTLLVIPSENFRGKDGPYFPNSTEDFLDFLRSNAREGLVPDICIDDSQFKIIALHHDLIVLGGIVVTAIVAPVAADLIGEYIKKKIWSDKAEEPTVKFNMTVVETDGKAKMMSYEGPASAFRKTIGAQLNPKIHSDKPSLEKK